MDGSHSTTKETASDVSVATNGNKEKVTLLGATGSIGDSTLEVIRANKDKYELHAVAAGYNSVKMAKIIKEFKPWRAALMSKDAIVEVSRILDSDEDYRKSGHKCELLCEESGICDISSDGNADLVVGAIVGAAGLKPLLGALKTGTKICLANKEALVMSGQIFFEEASKYGSTIIPVDSEHSAIFQCLPEDLQRQIGRCDLDGAGIRNIILTGSGGPFRDVPLENLSKVTPDMAVNHPVWSMGPKISIDSATMMNKALEYIEARYLFNAPVDKVKVIIHPQSVIHSMVSYKDGAVLAQLGQPDMKTPIARAMAFPGRIDATVSELDWPSLGELTFREPEQKRYPALFLGIEASKKGQTMTTTLNAANEVAVASFIEEKIKFTEIPIVIEHVLNRMGNEAEVSTIEEVFAIDEKARHLAKAYIASSH